MNCSQCGAPLEETDSVCSQCGAAVEREGVAANDAGDGAENVVPENAAGDGAENGAESVADDTIESGAESAADDGASVPPVTPATPVSSDDAGPIPPQPAGDPVYAKGCVMQALDDIRHLPGAQNHIVGICAIVAACGIVPVVGWVAAAVLGVFATGFALEWGRDLSLGRGIDRGGSFPRASLFSLGFFSGALEVALQVIAWLPVLALCMAAMLAAGGISSLFFHDFSGGYSDAVMYRSHGDIYGSGMGSFMGGLFGFFLLLVIVCIVFSLFMAMLSNAASMHLAVTGRIESAFSLKRIWPPVKRQFGKLFCCTFAPAVAAFLVAFLLIGCVMLLTGLIGGAFMYGGARFVGGFFFVLSPALSSFIGSFAAILAVIWQYRATGHWAARYAPQWAHEVDGADPLVSGQLPASK